MQPGAPCNACAPSAGELLASSVDSEQHCLFAAVRASAADRHCNHPSCVHADVYAAAVVKQLGYVQMYACPGHNVGLSCVSSTCSSSVSYDVAV